ncbi:hypothetical protein JB92DRAFT_2910900 [Gautieria morchelliformis]|nr:hypothetical protein JB92DRAFT_2910900 [Gautieria morchelliformis]
MPGLAWLAGLIKRFAEEAGTFLVMSSWLSALLFVSDAATVSGSVRVSATDPSTAAPSSSVWAAPFSVLTSSTRGGPLEFSSC